jgi:poly(3-hydroxybutyrate) depolymerase
MMMRIATALTIAAAVMAMPAKASDSNGIAALLADLGRQTTAKRVPAGGIAAVPAALAQAGVTRFVMDDWGGAPIPVWLLRPAKAGPDAPVMFVMHGVGRDADRYIAEWVEIATAAGIVVVVPEFTKGGFPDTLNYNFGAVFDEKGALRPRAAWSYSAIDKIFDKVVAREQLAAKTYVLFGHSAGAQFVHRFVLLGAGAKMSRAISANSGSYTWPTGPEKWPFGIHGLPAGLWQPATALTGPMLLMQGTADNDPGHPSLPRQREAMAQGPHRLARGKAFYAAAQVAAKQAGVAFGWSCVLVPDVAHDNGGMAPYVVQLLKVSELPKGGECRLLKKIAPGG